MMTTTANSSGYELDYLLSADRMMPICADGNCSSEHQDLIGEVQLFYAYHAIQRAMRNVVTPTLCILGCIGNIVNLLVITRMHRRKNSGEADSGAHLGLICLAVSDLCFCVFLLPRGFVPDTLSLFESLSVPCLYQAYGTGLVTTFILTSTWLTVVMTTIRYVGICHPFSLRKVNSAKFCKVSYILVFLLCFVCNSPSFMEYKITEVDLSPYKYMIDLGLFAHRSVHDEVFVWLKAIFGIFLPAMVMTFCNMSLIRALRRSYRMRKRLCHQGPQSMVSNRITLTLVAIVIAFVLLVFPCELMDFFRDFIKMDAKRTEIFLLVRAIANVLQIANFSLNFILYCVINVHFRAVVFDIVSCRGRLETPCCQRPEALVTKRPSLSVRTTVTNVHSPYNSGYLPNRFGSSNNNHHGQHYKAITESAC